MKASPVYQVLLCLVCYLAVVKSKVRSKRNLPNDEIWRILSLLDDHKQQQQTTEKRTPTSDLNSDLTSNLAWLSDGRWFPESYDYGSLADRDLDKRVFDNLGGYEIHSYKKRNSPDKFQGIRRTLGSHQSTRLKRMLDTLGGFQVHGWKKRALDSLGGYQVHGWKKRALDSLGGYQVHGWKKKSSLGSLGGFQVHGWKKRSNDVQSDLTNSDIDTSDLTRPFGVRFKRDTEGVDGQQAKETNDTSTDENKLKSLKDKKSLSDLGSFQVHGWKRSDRSDEATLGDVNADKKSLDDLGGFQVHGWKRGMDSLGGFQVHGWKRGLDSLGGYQVHGWKRSDDDSKRSLDDLGGFQVHGWKRSDDFDGATQSRDDVRADKRSLDELGSFQVHGWKRDDVATKRAFDRLGGAQVHGWKRNDDKRMLDSLGSFQVHGWKRGLDSLGGYQVHGWKRNPDQTQIEADIYEYPVGKTGVYSVWDQPVESVVELKDPMAAFKSQKQNLVTSDSDAQDKERNKRNAVDQSHKEGDNASLETDKQS